jgi:hypothetical protein
VNADAIRRANVASRRLPPQRAAKLLAFLRERDLTGWPPPPPTVDERRARWEEHVARYGLGPDRWATQWGPVTPYTRSEFHPDPARRWTFYLGVGHPHHLRHSPVPLFLSATTLARYRSRSEDFPVRMNSPWAGDSGAYAALMLTTRPDEHPWWMHPDEYGGMWVRFMEDVGPPDFVAVQDVPCEPGARRRTGLSVREHQEATLRSYLYLAEQFPMVPWLATLQGWHPWEYLEHAAMYERAGVTLAGRKVGVGSLCRRGSQRDIAAVLAALAPLGMLIHGFGVSVNALRLIGHLVDSSDSQAWSATARAEHIRLPGCTHMSRPDRVTGVRTPTDCRNCFRYALAYREEVMDAVRQAARPGRAMHEPLSAEAPAAAVRRVGATGCSHRRAPAPNQLALFDYLPAEPAAVRPAPPAHQTPRRELMRYH